MKCSRFVLFSGSVRMCDHLILYMWNNHCCEWMKEIIDSNTQWEVCISVHCTYIDIIQMNNEYLYLCGDNFIVVYFTLCLIKHYILLLLLMLFFTYFELIAHEITLFSVHPSIKVNSLYYSISFRLAVLLLRIFMM